MDFFTHFLIGLIVSYLVGGSNLPLSMELGVFMSLLPDLDFLMFPLWKKHPFTGHHGITHTPIFIIIASVVIYAALYVSTRTSDPVLLVVMLLAGLLHIFGDFLGTGGVALYYPFGNKYFRLNIDLGIDPLLIIFSIAGIFIFFSSYLDAFSSPGLRSVAIVLGLVFVLYYLARASLKLYLEHRPENSGFTALPTANPLMWKYARRMETNEAIEISLKTEKGVKVFTIPKERQKKVERCEDLPYTYWHPVVQGEMRFFEYPCYRIVCQEDKMEIIWNSAESGKVMDVQVTFSNGILKVSRRINGRKYHYGMVPKFDVKN
jgi:membrane-bound metal-dependent hydrolase YbcI (DUF457 family)